MMLTACARDAGVPVVFVQHELPSGRLKHQSESSSLERRLLVQSDDVFPGKTTLDSFLRTN
jgi:nicotinamidase-related amidase